VKRIRKVLTVLLAILASMAQPAYACMDIAPFVIEDVRQADAVFSGRLIDYRRISPSRPQSLDDYGLLTVRVDEVLKGDVAGEVQLYWWNSTFGVPEEMDHADRVRPIIIAAIRADRPSPPLRGPSATISPTQRPDLLQILQAPCSSPFILPHSTDAVEKVGCWQKRTVTPGVDERG
jgi:hypothetical protein